MSFDTLTITEQVLGPNHPTTASSLSNLGTLLYTQGDLTDGRPLFERALAIRGQVLGPDHPETATSLDNLGLLLQKQGDLATARAYHERALAIYEKILGPNHPDTATSLNNLGLLLEAQGDLAGARLLFERALTIREQMFGPDHPEIANSLGNLGLLLQAQNDPAAARPYFERALAIHQQRSERHLEGLCFSQLGQIALKLGQPVEGARLLAITYVIDTEIGHADAEQDLRSLTQVTEHLSYSEAQRDQLIAEVKAAYAADRGWSLIRAVFP